MYKVRNYHSMLDDERGEQTTFSTLQGTFFDAFNIMKRYTLLVIIITLVFAIGSLGIAVATYEEEYRVDASFTVTPVTSSDSTSGFLEYYFNYTSGVSETFARVFPVIAGSENLKNAIRYDLGRPMNGTITATPIEGSNVFEVRVVSNNRNDADEIMTSFVNNFPKICDYILGDVRLSTVYRSPIPTEPSNPPAYVSKAIYGCLFGLLISCAIFFVMAIFRSTIKNKKDVEIMLNGKCVCELPFVNRKKGAKNNDVLITASGKKQEFLESVRTMKKRVVDSLRENDQVIAVTSTQYGEGKTTVAFNLAKALASSEKKVLLLDLDFTTKEMQKKLFKKPEDAIGITEYCKEKADFEQVIHRYKASFDVTCAGWEDVKNNDPHIEKFLEQARERYDYIIVDTPPCNMLIPSAAVVALCDAVIYVVLSDVTPLSDIKRAFNDILYNEFTFLGFVVNGVAEGVGYGNYARYHYGYGYGYGYGYKYNYKYGNYNNNNDKL